MKTRDHNPARLDVEELARNGGEISGIDTQGGYQRLTEAQHIASGQTPTPTVNWSARGELRRVRGGAAQVWMHLRARTHLTLQCQRCLDITGLDVDIERSFRFVADEATAVALDAELDDADVLVADGALDLHALVEDEILLSLPIVPMHDVCPRPVIMSSDVPPEADTAGTSETTTAPDREHPFAALAALKRRSPTN
ncbi:MAG: hypothetical protein RLZZ584_731 [Pseudomonadota bacterium]|jgi:uncharacterized protein